MCLCTNIQLDSFLTKKKLSRKKNAERLKPEHIEESGSILGSLRTRMVGIQLGSDQSATNGPLS